ncbi:MAG: response regulator [Spirochaetales bacterium]|nr:response regulator [Spirochaetales bacterium]
MAKTILVIDESSLVRDFLVKQLSFYGFNVIAAINGLDGYGKLRSEEPDLVIMDFFLSRKSAMEILETKQTLPQLQETPVILNSTKLDKEVVMKVGRLGVKKILYKPIKIDALLDAVSEALEVPIEIDQTHCLLDAHLNDKILFIEIAQGFNREKFRLLRYKVAELLRLHAVKIPRILLLMTDIQVKSDDIWKLKDLLLDILDLCSTPEQIKILTISREINEYLKEDSDLSGVEAVPSLEKAMDGLLGIKGLEKLTAEQDAVQENFFSGSSTLEKETFQLNFAKEAEEGRRMQIFQKNLTIAVVDDDFIVHSIVESALKETNWTVKSFENGNDFLSYMSGDHEEFDLIFLDLIMPGMNGFAILQFLATYSTTIPVIVLTALSRKESVSKAMSFNIDSYLIKPIKPEGIINKALDVLNTDF